uniref:C6 domain-containing protein n=1 Tax=Caenorhabditis tropicalis TaxID=1561998 RepID=A0A1I7U0G1_9PELO
MHCQLLSLALFSSLVVVANQCAATDSGSSPVTTTTAVTTTTVSTTTTVVTTDCATCTTDLIGVVTGNDGDFPPTSVVGVDANGCATVVYTCERNPVVATDVVLITYYSDSQDPTDVGTSNGVGTANVMFLV